LRNWLQGSRAPLEQRYLRKAATTGGAKKSSSFLKKRTKKLLIFQRASLLSVASTKKTKVFGSFFQKRNTSPASPLSYAVRRCYKNSRRAELRQ
jgi:hypothetical protein